MILDNDKLNLNSSNYLRTALDLCNDGFWAYDSKTLSIIDVNEKYCRMSGYSRDEFLQLKASDIITTDCFDSSRVESSKANKYKTFHRKKNGTMFNVEVSVARAYGSENTIVCLCNELKDEKSYNDQFLLKDIIDSSEDYIYVKDRKLRTVICNKKFSTILGKKPEELIGKTDIENGWDPKYVKGDKEQGIRGYEKDDLKALSGEVVHVSDVLSVNGNQIYFDTIKLPLFDANNNIKGILGISRNVTDQKRIEDDLFEVRQRMEFALYASKIGAWEINLVDQSTIRTLQHDKIFGYEELLSEWDYEFFLNHVHPEDREMVDSRFKRTLKNKENWSFECRIYRADGKMRWIKVTGQSRSSGKDKRMAGIVQDITAQKISEQNTRAWHSLMEYIIKYDPNAIAVLDTELKFKFVSNRFKKDYNVDSENIIGRHHYDVFPDIPEKWRSIHKRALSGEVLNGDEEIFKRLDGSVDWTKWECRPWYHTQGSIGGIILYTEVITKRKQAEHALFSEKERLSVTLRSIGDGVITTDTKGKVVIMNKVAEQLTGWNQADAKGKKLNEVFNIVNEFTGKSSEDPVTKVLSTERIVELENHTVLIAKNGERRVIADSGAPIKDKEDKIIGVVLVFRDMTEKQKLLNAIQRAAKLNSLGILAGGIAHDFNNLLGGVFGYLDLASELVENKSALEYIEKSMSVIDRTKALTKQLLTFATGGEPVKKVDHLNPFLLETVHFSLSGSSVTCNSAIENDLWQCNFDKDQIGQVIDNIVINARQAMPDGGSIDVKAKNVTIKHKEHNILPSGNYVEISIKDYGIGIPKEIMDRIFDPFFTTKSQGHGLGLATCFSICDKHGGCIDVESKMGKGSTFCIYLPAEFKNSESDKKDISTMHKGKGTVVVLEDQPEIREIIGAMLLSFGYEAVMFERGNEAVQYFCEQHKKGTITAMIFDLTISGGMGGKEAIREVRKLCEKTPVFVVSGYAEDPIMANPKEYGFTDSISKPFRKIELSQLFDKNLMY
ncbi:PAS domain S-box protein [Chitinispirillales bacterium ANBcel5]|uniref:hybrid sensor histidine kinase/response regulator n=1 Tax=Cellulosispirillum alkaliphilum TaxID=3039283 RepID=UPI002A4F3A0A|nr:PAS domain S-box protein [Chitinispirillales bacterium ANBcel5]